MLTERCKVRGLVHSLKGVANGCRILRADVEPRNQLRSSNDPECPVGEEKTHGEGVAENPFTTRGNNLDSTTEEDHDRACNH